MTIALLLNRRAGHKRAASIESFLKDSLKSANIDYVEIVEPTVVAAAEKLRQLVGTVDAILAVGGDGTVHYGAQLAWQHALPFGIIPAGSGDDIARACGIPHGRNIADVKESVKHFIDAWKANDITAIDGAIVSTTDGQARLVLAVVSCGFDSRVSVVGARVTFPRGTMRYVYSMFATLAQFSPIDYELVVNGENRKISGMLLDVANGSTYGGGMKISPNSKIADGNLELLVLDKVRIPTLLNLFSKIFNGSHIGHPKISVEQVQSVKIHARDEQVWGDGEYVAHCPVTVRVAPQAIRIVGARP